MESMARAVVTTTWNSIDHLGTFLRHYRSLGFERILVMDFDSTDGTRDILAAREWQGFVEPVPFPGIASLDSSNIMLAVAKQRYPGDSWCLFCDPDELLVTPSMNVRELLPAGVGAESEVISIPRFNVTAPVSVARDHNQRLSATDALTFRIDGRQSRSIDRDILAEKLDPPWIFTAIPGKVMVRLDTAVSIGDGDHVARSLHDKSAAASPGTYLLHYPFRGYPAFRDKIEIARIFYASNPHLPPHFGWQVRRWIRLADSQLLYDEYLQQYIADGNVQAMLNDGVLVRDESIVNFHRSS